MQRLSLNVYIIVVGLVGLCHPLPAQAAQAKPNFIVIFTDDQGYADLGCFGGQHVHTPHIDQMAREGMRLTRLKAACASPPWSVSQATSRQA